jgi:cytoskeletal protein CcmA (bactofilin family)
MAFGKRVDEGQSGEIEVMSVRERGSDRDEVTVIGSGAGLEGLLVSASALRIEGEVKGEIRAEGDVVVAESARVQAELRAQNVRIDGQFTGNVETAGRVQLGGAARVQGNIICGSLAVVEGAIFNGKTTMGHAQTETAPVIPLPDIEPAGQG